MPLVTTDGRPARTATTLFGLTVTHVPTSGRRSLAGHIVINPPTTCGGQPNFSLNTYRFNEGRNPLFT